MRLKNKNTKLNNQRSTNKWKHYNRNQDDYHRIKSVEILAQNYSLMKPGV